jgi:hypothetical protein
MAYFYCKELQDAYEGEMEAFINFRGNIIIRCGLIHGEEKDDDDPKYISLSPLETKKLIEDLKATLEDYKGLL